MKAYYAFFLAAVIPLSASCSGMISSAAEQQAAQATASWFAQNYPVIEDKFVGRYFDALTTRLDRAAQFVSKGSGYGRTIQGQPWSVMVINDTKPNAFALGARTIVVTKGLVTSMNAEAELAAVLSHEMAHDILKHTRLEKYRSKKGPRAQVVFHPTHELEADELAVDILSHAGYDGRAALITLTRLYHPHGKRIPKREEALANRRFSQGYAANYRSDFRYVPGIVETYAFRNVKAALTHIP